MERNFSITAKGSPGIEVLSRITSLFMKNQVIINKLDYVSSQKHDANYVVEVSSDEKRMERIVNQINNIVEIYKVTLNCK